MWQTTCVALRALWQAHDTGTEAVLIDSPYFPDELELLPGLLSQAGFAIDGLLATHADFDHLLAPLAYPNATLAVGESTAQRLAQAPGDIQRQLRAADASYYVRRDSPLSVHTPQTLPVPGYIELGHHRVELHSADGHTADGTAFFARDWGVLVCGDYLSDVEIPLISAGGSIGAYRKTLERLAPLVAEAECVVPGHGSYQSAHAAGRILEEDLAYLDALERQESRPRLPKGRDTHAQRQIHAENLDQLLG
jgi:glyoxylase-like metal-dependent hydrolase (beta-lactamase superfamily II)